MTQLQHIRDLQQDAIALQKATTTILQSGALLDPEVRSELAQTLFEQLPMDELASRTGQPGFETAAAMINCITQARADFEAGNADAIILSTAYVKNDNNGNDITSFLLSFNTQNQSIAWKMNLVAIRDFDQWTVDLTTDHADHSFAFNGEVASGELRKFLLSALKDTAGAYVLQQYFFPKNPTIEELNAARALVTPYIKLQAQSLPAQGDKSLFLVSFNIRIGDAVKRKDKLVRATDEARAQRLAVESDCHQSFGDDEWEDGSVYDLHGEICYTVTSCNRVAPEHEAVMMAYLPVGL